MRKEIKDSHGWRDTEISTVRGVHVHHARIVWSSFVWRSRGAFWLCNTQCVVFPHMLKETWHRDKICSPLGASTVLLIYVQQTASQLHCSHIQELSVDWLESHICLEVLKNSLLHFCMASLYLNYIQNKRHFNMGKMVYFNILKWCYGSPLIFKTCTSAGAMWSVLIALIFTSSCSPLNLLRWTESEVSGELCLNCLMISPQKHTHDISAREVMSCCKDSDNMCLRVQLIHCKRCR